MIGQQLILIIVLQANQKEIPQAVVVQVQVHLLRAQANNIAQVVAHQALQVVQVQVHSVIAQAQAVAQAHLQAQVQAVRQAR